MGRTLTMGLGYTPTTTLKSEKTGFLYPNGDKTKESDYYWPNNFNTRFADDYITMIQALAYSDNIYALKTHYSIGFDKLVDIATRVGIETNISTSNPSAALGTTEITLLELVTGYSTNIVHDSSLPKMMLRILRGGAELTGYASGS